MKWLYRTILLILLAASGSQIYCSDIVLKEGNTDFFNLTEISIEEFENAVPADVREARLPEYLYNSSMQTSKILYGKITNQEKIPFWYIEFIHQLELVEIFYHNSDNSEWISAYSGDQVPMKDRLLPHSHLLLPLELHSGESAEIFIRVYDYQNKSSKIRIISPGTFLTTIGKADLLDMFLFSIIIIMSLFMLFHYYSTRKLYYLLYMLVMLFLTVTLLGKYRYFSYLVAPEKTYGYFIYIFFNSLAAAAGLWFTNSFFEIKRNSPIYIISLILSSGLIVIAAVSIFKANPSLSVIMNILIIFSLLLILFKTLRSVFSGDRASRVIIISFIPLLVGAVADNLIMYMDFSASPIPRKMILIGTAVHILIMNYGLAMRRAKQEREFRILKNQFSNRVEKSVQERTREIELDASIDPLTGVLNRAAMEKKIIEYENISNISLGILFADLDNFKHYNDAFSHKTGDRVLKEVAGFLLSHMRSQDSIFRYGGDEFLILMPQTSSGQAEKLGERLHKEFQKFAEAIDAELGNENIRLGLTLGFSVWKSGQSLLNEIDAADKAMMNAKQQGKNRIMRQS